LDVKDIAFFIAEDNPSAAKKFVKSLFQSVERLADYPQSGRVVPEFGDPAMREVIRRPCRIVYRIDSVERKIEIVRVWHAARGIPKIQ
jgi:plasmid stabilization system protein ParE